MPREIKINKKNLSLERRYEMRERRINMSPFFAGITLVCSLVLGVFADILGVLCGIVFLGFVIISIVCIEFQMGYDEWKNKYIKRRINKRWRKPKDGLYRKNWWAYITKRTFR